MEADSHWDKPKRFCLSKKEKRLFRVGAEFKGKLNDAARIFNFNADKNVSLGIMLGELVKFRLIINVKSLTLRRLANSISSGSFIVFAKITLEGEAPSLKTCFISAALATSKLAPSSTNVFMIPG